MSQFHVGEDTIFRQKEFRMPYNVDEEIELLSGHIKRLGKEEGDGFQVTFKVVIKLI